LSPITIPRVSADGIEFFEEPSNTKYRAAPAPRNFANTGLFMWAKRISRDRLAIALRYEVIDMAFEPYLRTADDGTYELLVPSPGGVHILPYCFHTEEDAANWLSSRKGREQIKQIRARYQRKHRGRNGYVAPLHAAAP
jgi:hypothetical protein